MNDISVSFFTVEMCMEEKKKNHQVEQILNYEKKISCENIWGGSYSLLCL